MANLRWHLKLQKLSLRHKTDCEATGPEAPSATYAVKVRSVAVGKVYVDDQVNVWQVKASGIEICRDQDPQPKRPCLRRAVSEMYMCDRRVKAHRVDDLHTPLL